MAHNGWRKPTPGLLQAEQYAQAGEQLNVPKSQAIVATKKIAAAIGLKAQDLLLLDTFGALTQSQDWEPGRRPIVWISNNFLLEQTGFSLPTLRRHIRRLCEAGVISMKDSPNGKRWGKRNDEGYITEAYGFDLAPLAARTEEFEALYAHLQEERQFSASMRNTITVMRRLIRAKIETALESSLRGPWRDLQEEFAIVLKELPGRSVTVERLLNYVDIIKALKERVEIAFEEAFEFLEASGAELSTQELVTSSNKATFSKNNIPTSLKNDTHILTTNNLHQVNSNCFEKKHAKGDDPDIQPTEYVDYTEDKLDQDTWTTQRKRERTTEVELSTVMVACPEFATMARGMLGGYVKNWDELHRAAGMLRPLLGISEHAWNVSQKNLGPYVAGAALALIYEKTTVGEVVSAGGYLRGIVEKALQGELHLERSFYGRLSGVAG